ncbi:MAG: A/G-specific adenine glycosylase [Bacteroidales bacterium]|nr:A/G-specific adenine glycosylase [Lentimicrobiaceae bacterium]MDD5694233.1 A/G-specific adenine glycosylase [Bacteroidales bacterium]
MIKGKPEIRHLLKGWYDQNKRDLPWRSTVDPYSIWISEVILQQTRVRQGQDYYQNFISHYPDVQSLAQAGEEDILRHWQGLGYYTRARNLLQAARIIHTRYNNRIPDTYKALASLPGIGDYTASAILSIAFGKTYPVVDGNVRRVISRLLAITLPVNSPRGRSGIYDAARDLVDGPEPGTFNQAIMEFGALCCKPRNPDCGHCILQCHCMAYRQNLVGSLPAGSTKATPRKRYLNYLVINVRNPFGTIILNRRTSRDIWMNMFDFPSLEPGSLMSLDELVAHPGFKQWIPEKMPPVIEISGAAPHILSHQYLYAKYFLMGIDTIADIHFQDNWILVHPDQLNDFPLPRMITRFLEKNLHLMGNKFPPFRINQ